MTGRPFLELGVAAALDPGIRRAVEFFRGAGHETTDSGDGVSKPPGPDVLPFPHVVILSTAAELMAEAHAVLRRCAVAPMMGVPLGARVEATYDPADQTAIIMVSWPPGATAD